MKIHHNTAKKAKAYGITLTVEDNEVVATKGGVRLASGLSGTVVLEHAIAKASSKALKVAAPRKPAQPKKARKVADDEGEEGEDDDLGGDDEGEQSKSIVKPKYRQIYKPHKMTNGDDLARELKDYLMVSENEDGKACVDEALLKRFAKANDCWTESYATLNVGQRRMNIGNRLRAKVRKDPEFKIEWPK